MPFCVLLLTLLGDLNVILFENCPIVFPGIEGLDVLWYSSLEISIWTEEIQIEELTLSSEIYLSEVGRIGFLYVFSKVIVLFVRVRIWGFIYFTLQALISF